MAFVVVLEPCRQLRQDRLSIRTIVNIHVIPFEGFDEGLCHPVRLRAAHRREARHQAQPSRKVDRLVRTIAAAVVGEPLDRVWQAGGTEASLNALEHQIPDHFPADAPGACAPSHHFAIACVQREGHTNDLADQQAISKPSEVQRRFGRIVMILPS